MLWVGLIWKIGCGIDIEVMKFSLYFNRERQVMMYEACEQIQKWAIDLVSDNGRDDVPIRSGPKWLNEALVFSKLATRDGFEV